MSVCSAMRKLSSFGIFGWILLLGSMKNIGSVLRLSLIRLSILLCLILRHWRSSHRLKRKYQGKISKLNLELCFKFMMHLRKVPEKLKYDNLINYMYLME